MGKEPQNRTFLEQTDGVTSQRQHPQASATWKTSQGLVDEGKIEPKRNVRHIDSSDEMSAGHLAYLGVSDDADPIVNPARLEIQPRYQAAWKMDGSSPFAICSRLVAPSTGRHTARIE